MVPFTKMLNTSSYISIVEVIIITVPSLLSVAFITVAERKTMASMQRRLGPNFVGYYGLLQAFADALKLLLKEYVSPTQANIILFFLGPVVTLVFSLLGFSVIPIGPGIALSDFDLGILYMLAVSSLSAYGILLAGWSANSKYAFLGSLRSTAQLISYELILSSAILLVVLLSGSLNLTVNIESQKAVWFIFPLLPVFIIFVIGSIAETNRAPFDLAEAESELVSGFMTEHAAGVFVFFFLAEYASILLICILTSILFIGGYLHDFTFFVSCINYLYDLITYLGNLTVFTDLSNYLYNIIIYNDFLDYIYVTRIYVPIISLSSKSFFIEPFSDPSLKGLFNGISLSFKSCIMVFIFIWARASLPRIRYDQLMSFCWTILLPLVIAFIILYPCILYNFQIVSTNTFLL
jgi:NADH-ubiquinone oxidoreductase chain 1